MPSLGISWLHPGRKRHFQVNIFFNIKCFWPPSAAV
jgi:hypothetical protein